jgi:thiosulfate/3-mercaptopyruvate sulfurtransferase
MLAGVPVGMNGGAARLLALVLLTASGVVPARAIAQSTEVISPGRLAGLQASSVHPPFVIDLRPKAEYTDGTVAGALHGEPDPDAFAPPGGIEEVVLIPPAAPDGAGVPAWADRLHHFGIRPFVLEGDPQAWRDAGVRMERPGPTYTDPGAVPYVVPRGICENLPPVLQF